MTANEKTNAHSASPKGSESVSLVTDAMVTAARMAYGTQPLAERGHERMRTAVEAALAARQAVAVPGAPASCKHCGESSLEWFSHVRVLNDVQQGRLNTHDVGCVFVLGCTECSATLHVVKADAIAALLVTTSPLHVVDPAPRPMDTAPRDGTMVRLLVQFTEHATEDTAEPAWTIGANNGEHDGGDLWCFAGWCWTHDHFTEGKGTPVGWLPLISNCDALPEPQQRYFFSEAMRNRVQAALNRVTTGHAPMRIPVDDTDVDVVLADVLAHITSQAGAK